jgi:replicative DNA helicase Mcm
MEKMDENERSALHEALEQQTVTIAKANVQATLQAQTSVLAAGNPKLGRFEPFQTIAQQIDLPPTLINRFDVIFIMRDLPNKNTDEAIANHVLSIYQKKEKITPVERQLFRKYVAYAKQKVKPTLTDEAVKEIKDFYVKMRNSHVNADSMGSKSIPISARQLEALVRLSEAHAKMRLSKKVTKEDARIAIDIIIYYMQHVGYDPETKSFDIDRIAVGVSSSQRSKVILLRETIAKLEERLGKFIPLEELEKELEGKLSKDDIDDAIQKLRASGDIFEPRRGFVQRV